MKKVEKLQIQRPVLRHKMYKSGKNWIVAGVVGLASLTFSMVVKADTKAPVNTTKDQTEAQKISNQGNAVAQTTQNSTSIANPSSTQNATSQAQIPALDNKKDSSNSSAIADTKPVEASQSDDNHKANVASSPSQATNTQRTDSVAPSQTKPPKTSLVAEEHQSLDNETTSFKPNVTKRILINSKFAQSASIDKAQVIQENVKQSKNNSLLYISSKQNSQNNSNSIGDEQMLESSLVENSNGSLSNPPENNGGNVSLDVDYEINKDVQSGTVLENHGSGTINNETVPTNNPNLVTYKQNTDKHWVEGSQQVDDKVYINGAVAYAVVTSSLPDPTTLAEPLSFVSVTDDYSQFASLVDVKSIRVLENGQDVTSSYNLTNQDGKVIATRKEPSKAPAGAVQLAIDFLIHSDVKNNTDLINTGSATINKLTVPTNSPKVVTYQPSGEKHWVLNNIITDNQLYLSGDQAIAQIATELPANLAKPASLVRIIDDYSAFASYVHANNVRVLSQGKDITSLYTITQSNGTVTATMKDPSTVNGGKVVLQITFDINNDTPDATVLNNKAKVVVDNATADVPNVKVVTWSPKATKDSELGYVSGNPDTSVNGKLVPNGQILTYPLQTSSFPAHRAEDITSHVIKDTLDENVKFLGFKAFIQRLDGTLYDVTNHIKLTQDGRNLTFTDDDALIQAYNKDKADGANTPIIDLFVQALGNSKQIKNQFTVYTNNNVTQSNIVTNTTPDVAKPTKFDLNVDGINIDGEYTLPGSVNNYTMVWKLSQYKGMAAGTDEINNGFYFIDDYPENALDADTSKFTLMVNNKPVQGVTSTKYNSLADAPTKLQQQLKAAGLEPKGAFIVWSPTDPVAFFNNYVSKGADITIMAPMTVKDAFSGEYQNEAYQLELGQLAKTNVVTNNVPKINAYKDVVHSVSDKTSLNNSKIKLGAIFDYELKGASLPEKLGTPLNQYGFKDDYDQIHDQYLGQYQVLLTSKVVLKNGTVLPEGTDVTNKTKQSIDTQNGVVSIEFNKDFLSQIDFSKSGFSASAFLNMKRIKSGVVYNKYTNIINGKDYVSNTVKTTTDEPVKNTSAVNKPKTSSIPNNVLESTTVSSKEEAQQLPQTGNQRDMTSVAGIVLLGVLGATLVPMNKKRYAE